MEDREDIIADLLLRWEESFEYGDDVAASELCKDHLELVNEVQVKIDDLKKMAWMNQDAKDSVADQPDELIGQTLGDRYRIESLIGRGGYGSVFKATDQELERRVAIKFSSPLVGGETDSLIEEARKVAKLRHQGIVSVHDVGKHDGSYFVVSELIEGRDLSELIAEDKLTKEEAVLLVAESAENLSAAHKAGFIHRDIKPANILIDENSKPLIADFGIASTVKAVSETSIKGTLAYMSPEQVANEKGLIDQRSDIYSLGVVLYELLTRELPYSANTPGKLREQILFRPPNSFRDQSVLDSVQSVCLKSLSKHPSDRFDTAQDFAVALRHSLTERPERDLSWTKWVGLLLIGTVLVAGGYFAGRIFDSREVATSTVEGGIEFDGTRRIVTPIKNTTIPFTIEAWIAPSDNGNPESQFVVGSDVPGHYGIGLGMGQNGHPMAEIVRGGLDGTRHKIPTDRWSHLAAVFTYEETRLYLEGQLVGTTLPTATPEVESPFVIGNLGEQHGNMCFMGKLRSVTITNGERFTDDFLSDPDFTVDPSQETVLIYGEGSFESDRILDLSGNGNHGYWDSVIDSTTDSEQDRAVAKVILGFGGEIEVLDSTGRRRVLVEREIPSGDFYLTEVKLLSNVDFDDTHLEKLRGLRRLESVYLSGSSITDDGLRVLQTLETLRQVGVGNSAITDTGISHLVNLPRLSYLSAGNTEITDDVFLLLGKMKNLRQLNIISTPGLSENAVQEFRDTHPECLVKFSH